MCFNTIEEKINLIYSELKFPIMKNLRRKKILFLSLQRNLLSEA